MSKAVDRHGVMSPIRLAAGSLKVAAAHGQPITIQVHGESGVGKTMVLDAVATECRTEGFSVAELDLQIVDLQTPSGFVAALLTRLTGGIPQGAIGLNALISELGTAIGDHERPLLITLDSVDHAPGAVQAIDRLIAISTPRVLLVTADLQVRRYLADHVTDIRVGVPNFSIEEIYELISKMHDAGQLSGIRGARPLAADLYRTLHGVPVLVRLALEAEDMGLIEFQKLPAHAQQGVPRRVLSGLQNTYPIAGKIWEVLSLVSAPMSPDFLGDLIDEPVQAIEKGLAIGAELGAVRDCGNGTFRLHDEVARQLRAGGAIGPEWLRQTAADLVASERPWSDLERLFLSTLADDAATVGRVLDQLQTSLRAGHGTDTRLVVETSGVLAEAVDNLECSRGLRAGANIAMSYAFTREHNSSRAVSSLDSVKDLALELPDMRPRWLLARAHATLSPARLPGQTLQTATDDALEAAGLFEAQADVPQQVAALVTYARALNLQGRHNDAQETLDRVLVMTARAADAVMKTLRADALDELGELHRLTQNMDQAEAHLTESLHLRETVDSGWSIGAAYRAWIWANLLRDRGDLDRARVEYDRALEGASAVGDEFLEQDIINDQSWLAYLAGDDAEAELLLGRQGRILNARGFHAGYATYHHGWHHLLMRQGAYDKAWAHLADALTSAIQVSHMYMLVDCLWHDAVRGLHQNDADIILASIAELDRLASIGCRFDGFRGRARMTLGDLYWRTDTARAFDEWFTGLRIVTDYGDSRRYEHSIADMIRERADKLAVCLKKPDHRQLWLKFWRRASTSKATKAVALELVK